MRETGAVIHDEHPFSPPESERDPVRRFRGRLAAPVTLWTAAPPTSVGSSASSERSAETGCSARPEESPSSRTAGTVGVAGLAGLPVSSMMVAEGERPAAVGLIDPDSEFWAVASAAGRFAISILTWRHRDLSDAFAGLLPAPGGAHRLTEWTPTSWGPVPSGVSTWAGCVISESRRVGWSLLVEAELAHVEIGTDQPSTVQRSAEPSLPIPAGGPLLHLRGRYRSVAGDDDGGTA